MNNSIQIYSESSQLITTRDASLFEKTKIDQRLSWGLGPYFEHRLFNPEMR